MKYLWIIRHGKSADGHKDHERTLNARGLTDGQMMQAWYASQTHAASWIWSSSAVRARTTAGFVAEGFGGQILQESDLYLSAPETILGVLSSTPDTENCAAVVAHNPGLTYLTNLLGGSHITDNLVTFGSVLFCADIKSWRDLRFGNCEMITYATPKNLA
ncbi:MAG: histidine phosphatase family protein [Pseudomonadota bacterium]